ncbi:hypothetical protein N0V93_000352 [Gnomoniopsis smithogilvyi]|uniref:Uncharacterized protein n=1 Tax=Gnomoniopsis smithogilvyi TaxID=1191159 RepID=A0A9W8Z3I0_9PEZI|nr:hypothetical protein N0V93_000352 [Gnomoniopsis smithogilvyi]
MSASLALQPLEDSEFAIFVKTQFRTKPQPLPSSLSFQDRICVVTGANSGLGLEACKQLLAKGLSRLIMGVRNQSKGDVAAASLRKQYPGSQIDVWLIDLESYPSVQAFAQKCAELPRLDMALLNAGMATDQFVINEYGHELTVQVNYLSTALLAILLLPVLKSSSLKHPNAGAGRLTIVSSTHALTAPFPPTDKNPLLPVFNDPEGWSLVVAHLRYQTTKILVLMLVQKLAEAVSPEDDHVIINAVDPAMVSSTNMTAKLPFVVRAVVKIIGFFAARSAEQGTWSNLDALAVKRKESHGGFCVNWEIYPFHPKMYTPEGRQTTDRLWEETLTELEFAGARRILGSMSNKKAS